MKYKILFSAKVYLEEIIEANSFKEATEKASKEFLNEDRIYEIDECASSEILPQEKYYFRIERVEKYE